MKLLNIAINEDRGMSTRNKIAYQADPLVYSLPCSRHGKSGPKAMSEEHYCSDHTNRYTALLPASSPYLIRIESLPMSIPRK